MLVHGDFTPWNIAQKIRRWVMSSLIGSGLILPACPAYDLLHFQFNDDRHFGEKAGGYAAIRARSICAEILPPHGPRCRIITRLPSRFCSISSNRTVNSGVPSTPPIHYANSRPSPANSPPRPGLALSARAVNHERALRAVRPFESRFNLFQIPPSDLSHSTVSLTPSSSEYFRASQERNGRVISTR